MANSALAYFKKSTITDNIENTIIIDGFSLLFFVTIHSWLFARGTNFYIVIEITYLDMILNQSSFHDSFAFN